MHALVSGSFCLRVADLEEPGMHDLYYSMRVAWESTVCHARAGRSYGLVVPVLRSTAVLHNSSKEDA
jgi:hypothetical protein